MYRYKQERPQVNVRNREQLGARNEPWPLIAPANVCGEIDNEPEECPWTAEQLHEAYTRAFNLQGNGMVQ